MQKISLGSQGAEVSRIGLGCMGISDFYTSHDEGQAQATIQKAIELGVTFFDTADIYGIGKNEAFLGDVMGGGWRKSVFLATKCGSVRTKDNPDVITTNGTPDYIRGAVEASLTRLRVENIDLLYLHRIDPNVPIEETIGAMSLLVKQGKVNYIGLSEASSDIIRRAHDVHPITALQSEYKGY